MRWYYLLLIAATAACGAIGNDNVLPDDGPIPNPAIDAGATQLQGAVSADGEGGLSADGQRLNINIDGETVIVESAEELEEIISISGLVADCRNVLAAPPTNQISTCSHDLTATAPVVDTVSTEQCSNGRLLYLLNRPEGVGAFVGVEDGSWVEFEADPLSIVAIERLCEAP